MSEVKKKPRKDENWKRPARITAGALSILFGLPNFIVALSLTLAGIGLTVLLGYIAYRLYTGDAPDNICGPLIIALLIILVVVLLVAAIILTILSFIFALAVGGQVIGGIYTIRGRRYHRALTLTLIGTVVSLLAGIGLLIYGIGGGNWDWFQIGALIWGIYDILAFFVTLTASILIIVTRSTFDQANGKEKGKKKEKEKNPKKKDDAKNKKQKKKEPKERDTQVN
ncbi:MAG: hypothetical protein ACMUIE_01120 [Thermoplasmatota archaeon]